MIKVRAMMIMIKKKWQRWLRGWFCPKIWFYLSTGQGKQGEEEQFQHHLSSRSKLKMTNWLVFLSFHQFDISRIINFIFLMTSRYVFHSFRIDVSTDSNTSEWNLFWEVVLGRSASVAASAEWFQQQIVVQWYKDRQICKVVFDVLPNFSRYLFFQRKGCFHTQCWPVLWCILPLLQCSTLTTNLILDVIFVVQTLQTKVHMWYIQFFVLNFWFFPYIFSLNPIMFYWHYIIDWR